MGNMCLGKKKKKDPKRTNPSNPSNKNGNNPTPNTAKQPEHPKKNPVQPNDNQQIPQEQNKEIERPGSPIPNPNSNKKLTGKDPKVIAPIEDQLTNLPPSERDLQRENLPDYSFMKIAKTGKNNFSFEVYGQEISQLNPVFLRENLGNISQTSKFNISRNDLLLLTEENVEIRRFLEANNLNLQDIRGGFDNAPRMLNSGDSGFIQPLGQLGKHSIFVSHSRLHLFIIYRNQFLKISSQNCISFIYMTLYFQISNLEMSQQI